MKYYIFTLKFEGAFRFSPNKGVKSLENSGKTLSSDSLFSAIASEGVKLYGENFAAELFEKANKDSFLLSDLLPYCRNNGEIELFIPRPRLSITPLDGNPKALNDQPDSTPKQVANRKKLKQCEFIPLAVLDEFIEYMKTRDSDTLEKVLAVALPLVSNTDSKNSISFTATGDKETLPYSVVSNRADASMGYYFILGAEDELKEKIEQVIKSLQYTGLGGKKSSGYGKFHEDEDSYEIEISTPKENLYPSYSKLASMLSSNKSEFYMALSSVLPDIEELRAHKDRCFYSLSKRGGFVASERYSPTPLKKKTVVMMNAGSCFPLRIKSRIIDVQGAGGSHPVYRMGKALLLGVDVNG